MTKWPCLAEISGRLMWDDAKKVEEASGCCGG